MATILIDDYKANGRRSTRLLSGKLGNLRAFFGMDRAADITADRITAYVASRLEAKAANSTINRDLACLKRAFRLAHRAGRAASVPHISLLHEANARKGFFEDDQFRAVLGHLPDHVKPVVQVAFITGWRIASEIVTRKKHHLDLGAGWLRLEPNETKNGSGRMFPLTPEYEAVAQGLRVFRENDWILEVGHGQTTISVAVTHPEVQYRVRIQDFERWLESQGRTPAEMRVVVGLLVRSARCLQPGNHSGDNDSDDHRLRACDLTNPAACAISHFRRRLFSDVLCFRVCYDG